MDDLLSGIHCINCGSMQVSVIDSRPIDMCRRKRRYLCHDCDTRFNTVEMVEDRVNHMVETEKRLKLFKKFLREI